MPTVATIIIEEIVSSLRPAIEEAVRRALGGATAAATPTPIPTPKAPRRQARSAKKAKAGVYIVGASRGRLPDWLKAAAKAETSADVSAKWPKGTELHKDAPLPVAASARKVPSRKAASARAKTKTSPKATAQAGEATE